MEQTDSESGIRINHLSLISVSNCDEPERHELPGPSQNGICVIISDSFPSNSSQFHSSIHQPKQSQNVKKILLVFSLPFVVLGFAGCEATNSKPSAPATSAPSSAEVAQKSDESAAPTEVKVKQPEPSNITVQHCLIGFKGSVPGKPISRTKEEAKELATKLLEELKAGADFDDIIRKNTDDSPPGIYKMANFGVSPNAREQVFARGEMVPAFGDTGFPLQVGEYGLAEFDTKKSPYGWHIVKRVE